MGGTSRNYGRFTMQTYGRLLPRGVILYANQNTKRFALYRGKEKVTEVSYETAVKWRRKAEVMAYVARRALLVKERGY